VCNRLRQWGTFGDRTLLLFHSSRVANGSVRAEAIPKISARQTFQVEDQPFCTHLFETDIRSYGSGRPMAGSH
jgi:hypothetical protein